MSRVKSLPVFSMTEQIVLTAVVEMNPGKMTDNSWRGNQWKYLFSINIIRKKNTLTTTHSWRWPWGQEIQIYIWKDRRAYSSTCSSHFEHQVASGSKGDGQHTIRAALNKHNMTWSPPLKQVRALHSANLDRPLPLERTELRFLHSLLTMVEFICSNTSYLKAVQISCLVIVR